MSFVSAGPGAGVEACSCGAAVGVAEGDVFVGTVVGVAAGSVVDFATGGIAVGTAAFFVGAACGAQAASVNVSTNTVLKRNLIFIFFSPSWA